jgi:phage tail-like protein
MTDTVRGNDLAPPAAPPAAPVPAQPGPPAPASRPRSDDAVSPFPLGAMLPGVFQADPFTQMFCSALDRVVAPVVATLDSMPAYLDPATAPPDMLAWLGSWVGLALEGDWPDDRRRVLVAAAAGLHARRGTRAAIEDAVRLATGLPPRLEESGGTSVALDPRARVPGEDEPFLVVVVPEAAGGIDETALRGLVALLVPAHVPWELRRR